MLKSDRLKPGRKSIVATHPERDAIETACAAGITLRRISRRFGISHAAIHRHWHGLPFHYRDALTGAVAQHDDTRWREVTAGLVALARRHPEARADIDALTRRLGMPAPGNDHRPGGRAHAA